MARRAHAAFMLALSLHCGAARAEPAAPTGTSDAPVIAIGEAERLLPSGELTLTDEGRTERDFLDGMIRYSAKDYRQAEDIFRRILDREPGLLRVRLELARTLFMQKKDEQADYHFRLAAGEHPPLQVARNILRFREAIRDRRAWRFNVDFGFAPDSNINSATDKQAIDIYGLPFQLDPGGRARSGTGKFVGGDASIRLNRFGKIPIYADAYGRWTSYNDHRFDDVYAGGETGPEFRVAGGQLRTMATGLMRWYGRRPLVASFGTRFDFDKLVGDKWTIGGTLLLRHNDYARRRDIDGWDAEARAAANRPIGRTTLGFANVSIERGWANDPGQAFWREGLGWGVLSEIGWGLRPGVRIDIARQVNDGPLAPFAKERRDWLLQASFSLYKRDWNLRGFAPSLSLTITRNYSTLSLYDERRMRGEVRLTRAF
jgi:hypothetical protein